ncbi:MAG: LamG-like jellyroll fold domain-containing protein [Planctomycetota bacterium]
MYKRFICSVTFILVLCLAGSSFAQDDPSLVGWWTFDEGSGSTAADSSGNGNTGTLNGPVEWTADGKIGGAMKFTGPYNYVLVQNNAKLNPTRQITIAAWVNPSWTGNNRILQKSTEGSDNQYRLLKEGGNNIRFHIPPAANFEVTGNIPPNGEWTHLAATYDGSMIRVYFNAAVVGETAWSGTMQTSDGPLFIGTKWSKAPAGDEFNGMMDDVRIYDRALSVSELKVLGGEPMANTPVPADRAIHEDTWVTLNWTAGAFAVSHDVYFSDNLSDVQNSAPEAFRGNQATAYLVVGFPGFPYPDGLVPGTTYYWRVDEVNDANPDSPWVGGIWRFTVPPKIAWRPMPPDKARLVDPDTDLSWSPGWGAKMHTVYFGDNFDDVSNATGGSPQIGTTYALNTLEMGKAYYWRVDEFDARETHKGDVWSFTTGDASLGGIKGEYFNNVTLAGTPVLSRVDPDIDFNWGGVSPGPGVVAPVFSVRWTGMLNVPFTETYTIYANVFSAVRVWVDGQLIINNWMAHHMAIEYQAKIDLEVGTVPIVMEIANVSGGGYGGGANMQAQLSWSNPSLPKEIVPQTALLLPVWAIQPNPADGAVDVKQTSILRWTAGDEAASHQVYFGTDENAVLNADTSSPEYMGAKDIGDESSDPGKLEYNSTYYWRVDEINDLNPSSPWKGDVWSFTTAGFLVIDDFEAYDIGNNEIWWAWKDGLGYAPHHGEPVYPGNGTGSAVGDETTSSYTEETIVHGGRQAMPLYYDNTGVAGKLAYSEVELTLGGRDLTENGGTTLTIWFRGIADNGADPVYVALNGNAIVTADDPAASQIGAYVKWQIPLQQFADLGVDLTNVGTIAVGTGNKSNPQPGGSGTMYFDDIGVH